MRKLVDKGCDHDPEGKQSFVRGKLLFIETLKECFL